MRPVRRGARLAARILGASAALVTLMACYGMIAKPYREGIGMDRDGDGVGDADCDDARADIYPGAADREGDGVDQNCDGVDGWRDPNAPAPVPTPVATEPAATEPAPPPKAIATDPPATTP